MKYKISSQLRIVFAICSLVRSLSVQAADCGDFMIKTHFPQSSEAEITCMRQQSDFNLAAAKLCAQDLSAPNADYAQYVKLVEEYSAPFIIANNGETEAAIDAGRRLTEIEQQISELPTYEQIDEGLTLLWNAQAFCSAAQAGTAI